MPALTPKICMVCNQDCSKRPRVKDARGRYTCQACVGVSAQGNPGKQPTRASAPVAESRPDIDVEDAYALQDLPESRKPQQAAASSRPCFGCGYPALEGSVVCVTCGCHPETGKPVKAPKSGGATRVASAESSEVVIAKGNKCGKCGYSMKGVRGAQCPECGSMNREATANDRDRQWAARDARLMYIKPMIGIAAGLGISLAIVASAGGSILALLIGYAISLVISFAAFFVCSLIFIGFDEPIVVAFLRMGAVVALTLILEEALSLVPGFGMFKLLLYLTVFAMLLVSWMEIDIEDAWIVLVGTIVAKLVTTILIMKWMGML